MGEIIPHKVFAAGYFASKNLINVKVKKKPDRRRRKSWKRSGLNMHCMMIKNKKVKKKKFKRKEKNHHWVWKELSTFEQILQ